MRRLSVVALVVSLAALRISFAQAQGPGGPTRFRPSRPTISPYLNLLRRDVGPLPNYYSLVRPQLEQLETNRQQQAINTQQQTQIRDTNRKILGITESSAAPTGTGSTYRNYGHYYPSMSR